MALSQTNTQSKREYQIDNVNKLVAVPFDTIYVWGNYFIRYEYLEKDNRNLNSILKTTFTLDSLNNITVKRLMENQENIIKEKTFQHEFVLKKYDDCQVTSSQKDVTIVQQNTKLDIYKSKYTIMRDAKIFGTGMIIGTILKILIFK